MPATRHPPPATRHPPPLQVQLGASQELPGGVRYQCGHVVRSGALPGPPAAAAGHQPAERGGLSGDGGWWPRSLVEAQQGGW